MSTVLNSPRFRKHYTANKHPSVVGRLAGEKSRRRAAVRPLSNEDESRFLMKCVAAIVLAGVTPLLVYLIANYFDPQLFQVDITAD